MFKGVILFLIFNLFCLCLLAASEGDTQEDIPSGMEVMEVGKTKVLTPEDTKTQKKGGLVILENTGEYAARKIKELEERLVKIEARLKEIEGLIGKSGEDKQRLSTP